MTISTIAPDATVNGMNQPSTLEEALAINCSFAVIPEPSGRFDIVFPDLPGCPSFARTLDEVPQQVRHATASWIEASFEMNHPIPTPSTSWDPSPIWPTEPIKRLDGQPEPAPKPIYTAEYVADLLDLTPNRVRQIARARSLGQMVAEIWMFTPADVVAMQDRPGRGRPARSRANNGATVAATAKR